MRRLRRWLARGLVAVALVAAALAVASRTGAARALERRAVVRVLEAATGGRVAVALLDRESPRRFAATALTLAARGRLERGGAELEVATIRFVPRGLALAPVAAAGRVTARLGGPARLSAFHLASGRSRLDAEAALDGTGAIDAHLALAPLAAVDVRALAPRSELATDLRARVRMRGPWHALAVAAHADLGRGGRLHARAALDATARPVAYAARLAFARLDPGVVLPRLPRAEADGQLAFRGAGGAHRVRGVVRTPLGEAALQGRLAPGTPPAYRLFARVSLPRLEALDARVTGSASGRVRLDGRGFDAADHHARARRARDGNRRAPALRCARRGSPQRAPRPRRPREPRTPRHAPRGGTRAPRRPGGSGRRARRPRVAPRRRHGSGARQRACRGRGRAHARARRDRRAHGRAHHRPARAGDPGTPRRPAVAARRPRYLHRPGRPPHR